MSDSIKAYSQADASSIIASSANDVAESRNDAMASAKNQSIALPDRIFGLVVAASKAFLDAGFGTGIMIVSGEKTGQSADALEEQMGKIISIEEMIRATVQKIDKINKSTGTTDVKAEVPNWSKTVGATLPSWSSEKERQDLVTLILNQMKANVQIIAPFLKSRAENADADQRALLASTSLNMEFLFGIVEAFLFAKRSEIEQMTATWPIKKAGGVVQAGQEEFFETLKNAYRSFEVTSMIAGMVARTTKAA